jgi:hypothetical protein
MGRDCPIRQLVGIGETSKVYLSWLVELHLRCEVESPFERRFARVLRSTVKAQTVRTHLYNRCGRQFDNLLCSRGRRSVVGTVNECPSLSFPTASGTKVPAFFSITRLGSNTQTVLQGCTGRWSCEVVNFYLKTQLGLADFRVRSFEACDKYVVAVHLAWAYVERRFVLERGSQVKTYGDLIRRHREEHAVVTLESALTMMQAALRKRKSLLVSYVRRLRLLDHLVSMATRRPRGFE